MSHLNKQSWWLAGFLVVVISLFTGATVGGATGYFVASNLAIDAQPVVRPASLATQAVIERVDTTASSAPVPGRRTDSSTCQGRSGSNRTSGGSTK